MKYQINFSRLKNNCFVLLSLLIIVVICQADTEVFGDLDKDTYWNYGGSPYLVTGDVTVKATVNLTIEEGVVVKFCHFDKVLPYDAKDPKDSLYATLIIEGSITAEGTPRKHIKFINYKKGKRWQGIILKRAEDIYTNFYFL